MKSMQTFLALALFAAAGIFAVGCGETATTNTTTPPADNTETAAAQDEHADEHAGHEHTTVSLKLPGMT